jgi:CheY-like chemotaxis protein
MTQLCEGLGHSVHATQSGADGVGAIKAERPDLLIVDLRIGDMNGLEIIEMCANEYPGMPIIMVTGFGSI